MMKNKEHFKIDTDIYQRIFDCIQNGIMVTDGQGIVTHLNKPYARFLNLDPGEQIGRHCSSVVENTRMHIVARTGKAEINHIQQLQGMNILVQRIPIKEKGRVIAVFGLVMFSDLKEVTLLAKKIGQLESKVKLYEKELMSLRSTRYSFDSILGKSRVMEKLKKEALKATANEYPVLILGDCGTGKELFAQAIHHSSARNLHPFVKINCAAIPKNLLESELFGYDQGAFTGAKKGGKPGKFELAHRGSIFLDEIGDLPLEMQPKLLRVIEEKEFERIGGTRVIKSDFRLIAATNRDLESMVQTGEFRRDLFYRLNVIPLMIPSLETRKEDIGLLTRELLEKMARETGQPGIGIHEKALDALMNYHWPGNVRELVNVLERTLSNLESNTIHPGDLPRYIRGKGLEKACPSPCSLRSALGAAEKTAIEIALESCDYNKTSAAGVLGIHRTLLYRKIKKHGIPLHP